MRFHVEVIRHVFATGVRLKSACTLLGISGGNWR